MEPTAPGGQASASQRLEMVARTLRHEVGDLLQTVYSTVAILQERLAADQALERRLLTDLKGRAENCRNELDAVVDLVCPLRPTHGRSKSRRRRYLSTPPSALGDPVSATKSR